jgi:hypothetical protein
MYNLTDKQKELARRLVRAARAKRFKEEFEVFWIRSSDDDGRILTEAVISINGSRHSEPGHRLHNITKGELDALMADDLLRCEISYSPRNSGGQDETNRRCTLTGKIYKAVDTNFNAPDTSFIKYLNPLPDVNGFDEQLKMRCLPILSAGSTDALLWDSAVRTAGVILEERLRDVGSITDLARTGRNLVNDVFGNNGTLASKFSVTAERDGYRDLYAGMVGVFRNPSAHRFIDPSPEEGGAVIIFVNLLLKKLEALR